MEEEKITQEDIELAKEFNAYKEKEQQNALVTNPQQSAIVQKSIKDMNIEDVVIKVDTDKDYKDQIKEVNDAKITVEALNDDSTRKTMVGLERSKHIGEKVAENNDAQVKVTNSKTEISKAEHEQYAGILETFGFYEHYPSWMTKIITYMLTPFQLLIGFVIGIFCGTIKILIDNVEGIVVKYDKFDEKKRPKIKVTIIIILVLASITAICLTTLGCLHII